MDLNQAYAAHQLALIDAGRAHCPRHRANSLAAAARIAGRIGAFQRDLGARAAKGWLRPAGPILPASAA